MARALFCTRCYAVGKPKTLTKGSFLLEIVLWLMFIGPGLIYSIWRLTTRHPACRSCGGSELVPPESARARQFTA